MINNYNLLGRSFVFEIYDDNELTSNLIRQYGSNIDMETVYAYKYLLKEGDTFIDVGANIGWNSIFGSFAVGNTGQVIAFEPEQNNFSLLEKNIKLNQLSNVNLHLAALGKTNKLGRLYKSKGNYGNHLVDPVFLNKNSHEQNFTETSIISLDSFLQSQGIAGDKIKLIKIDTEGSEANILRGAEGFFSTHKPHIILEFSPFHLKQCSSSLFDIFSFIDRYQYIPNLIKDIDLDKPDFHPIPLTVIELFDIAKYCMSTIGYRNLLLSPAEN